VVPNAERADRQTADQALRGTGDQTRVLFITRARLLPWYMEKPDPPVVIAKDQKYALVEWPRTDNAPSGKPAQGQTTRTETTASHHGPAPAFHPFSRGGLYATLLLILANSRH